MASLQAHHALLYLGLGKTPLKQKLMLWDGLSMKQRLLAFEKDTDCPLLSGKIDLQTNIFLLHSLQFNSKLTL